MQKKKLHIWLPLLFSITMIAGMFIGYKLRDGIPGKNFFYVEKRRPVQEILDLIKNRYVDTVDIAALSDSAILAILLNLDPHSVFIPAEQLQAANEDIVGNFYGIGIEFNVFKDTLHVINVLKDGPSFKAGLMVGDKILKAGDTVLSGKNISIETIRNNLRGPLNAEVNLGILRNGKPMNVPVNRGVIPLSSVDAAYMIDSSIGFIRLNKFSQQTYREFMLSLESLKKQGLKKLVLDLRGNGGGVLDEAIEIADEFLEGDKLISYTEGAHLKKKEYRCRRQGQFETGALAVLADEGSASASEILLGALQDWDRATIIGRRTFGKGLVQEQYDLSDKSALRLTVARYFTPLGRSIQRPYGNGGRAYYEEINKRYSNGGMYNADSLKNDTSKVYTTKAGKKIYGKGGITPDYFVAADTATIGKTTAKLYSKGLLNDFGYQYYLQNPGIRSKYKTAPDFAKSFKFLDADWQYFQQEASKDSISLNNIAIKEKAFIVQTLTASIARQLFRIEGYYEVRNKDDETLMKALKVLRN